MLAFYPLILMETYIHFLFFTLHMLPWNVLLKFRYIIFVSDFRYNLAQEHGDIINLHDWYQSFKSIVFSSRGKGKNKSRQSPPAKKRKVTSEPENQSEAHIQYPIILNLFYFNMPIYIFSALKQSWTCNSFGSIWSGVI